MVSELIHFCNISKPSSNALNAERLYYYDLTFVLSGSLEYVIDGRIVTVCKNDCIFLKPDSVRARNKSPIPVSYVSFNFLLPEGCDIDLPVFSKNVINTDIKSMISVFAQNHISPNFHSSEKCISILNYIIYELLDNTELKSQNPHIRKMLKYIDEHLGEPIGLCEVSRFINLSPEYASTLFRRQTGKTMTDYINEKKMLYAKKLISEGSMPLVEIAPSLGFENYNYFSRLFKKLFGASPKSFKNRF
jgi:AraC-like DNA-binding protein